MEMSSTVLTNIQEEELWRLWKLSRDVDAYHKLIDRYRPLAKSIAHKQYLQLGHNEVELEDFYQTAMVGLMEAIDRFEPSLGTQFSTFATFRIKGIVHQEIGRYSERRNVYLNNTRKREKVESISHEAKENPHENEFEEFVDITLGLAIDNLLTDMSQEVEHEQDTKDPYHGQVFGQIKKILTDIVDAMQSPDDLIVRYHYFYHMAFSEIGRIFGFSITTVYRIHGRALRMIRRVYERQFEFEKYY